VLLGAQDCHEAEQGAHTGHISAAMLEDCGCDFTLVGHSERRADDGETNTQVKAKAERAIAHGVHAVVCVGETQSERETGDYLQVIEKQLRASLPAKHAAADLTIAYEPVWAIGTGKTASLDDISEVHGHIKGIVSALQKEKEEDIPPRVIYGGSVNANNALEILSLPVVDGVLVGGASLDAESFSNIIRAASQAAGS
ncbi:MAG: triose-phosphate isomerase, partial [Rickettsiales bacterium]